MVSRVRQLVAVVVLMVLNPVDLGLSLDSATGCVGNLGRVILRASVSIYT